MLYTGIIAALSSLDLGIKWLIEREKPEDFPKPLPHTKEKILLYRNHNAGFPFGFLEQHGELVRMLPLAVISGLAGFLTAILPQKDKKVQKLGIAIILGVPSATFMTAWCGVMWWITSAFSVEN